MEARDELIKARVRLQQENPFFSWLVMGLTLREVKDGSVATCGVDFKGNLYYNPKWIEKLTQPQIKTLLSHEVMHIALLHLTRARDFIPDIEKDGEKRQLVNIAEDMVINNMLVQNDFEFSGELLNGVVPKNNELIFNGTTIKIKDIY